MIYDIIYQNTNKTMTKYSPIFSMDMGSDFTFATFLYEL